MKGKNKKRFNKKFAFLGIIGIVCISLFLLLCFLNYVPFFLKPVVPIGNYEEKTMETYIEKYPIISQIPNLDKIDKNFYETDENTDSIVESYKQKLLNEGYSLEYEDILTIEDKEYKILGFLKGFTAVGILISNNEDNESEVIYTTGSALDFIEILEWYQNQ